MATKREILFRGKRIDTGEWVYGYYVLDRHFENHYIICNENVGTGVLELYKYEVIPETIGQFTGLLDKNNNKIFEEDIINVNSKYFKIIKYLCDRGAFVVANIDDIKNSKWKDIWSVPNINWWNDFNRDIQIIGNIHDNADLLENIKN